MSLAPFPEYDAATEAQKAVMCDGCGQAGKVWIEHIPVPLVQWQMVEPCRRHDFRYAQGGTEADRLYADACLLEDMHQRIADELEWYKKPFAYALARIYYWAVDHYGPSFFRYGTKMTAGEWVATYANAPTV